MRRLRAAAGYQSKRKRALKKIVRRGGVLLTAIPLVTLFRLIGPPRVLRYGRTLNRILLRAFGASVGDNVLLYSPIVLHNSWRTGDFRNLTLGDNCLLNGNNYLDISAPLILDAGVSLGPGVTIMTHNSYHINRFLIETLKHTCGRKPVHIKQGAGIKAHALIVHGVTVGANAVVAGGAVVNRDVPDNCFVAGVPARVLQTFASPPIETEPNSLNRKETIAWT